MPVANDDGQDIEIAPELNEAGTIVDRAIEQMLKQNLPPMAIASALLGGSLCLLSRTMGDEALLHVLNNAAAGVRAGELRQKE
jgi:hypothetical protein